MNKLQMEEPTKIDDFFGFQQQQVINKIFKISRNQHKVKSCGGTS
jgi:hypothetical protein